MNKPLITIKNTPLITIKNLNKYYKQHHILKDINFSVNIGERIGIVGPNGNGKTSLCEIITKIRVPTSGKIIYYKPVKFGMQLQSDNTLSGTKPIDLLKYLIEASGEKFDYIELDNYVNLLKLEDIILRPMNKLSGGEKQRVNLLLAMINDNDLIILDELSSNLDVNTRDIIYNFIEQKLTGQTALIMISHNMAEIEKFCDRVIMLKDNRIKIDSKISDIAAKYGSLEKYVIKEFGEYYAKMKVIKQTKKGLNKWERKVEAKKTKLEK